MPEPLPPTLVEIRNAVLTRAGFSTQGNNSAGYYPLVDELARKAQRELHMEAPWIREYTRTTQALVTDQQEYDFPDDALMSNMGRIAVINTDDNEFNLVAADGATVRNTTKTSSQPIYVEYVNGVIRISPAPTDDWVTLVYEYYAGPAALVADTDRPSVDGECLIQRTSYLLKRHTGLGGDWQADQNDHMRYLQRMQEQQGVVRSISMRGAVPMNTNPRGWYVRNRNAWTTNWNPW